MLIKRKSLRAEIARKGFLEGRRNFLKSAGLAGVGAVAGSLGMLAEIILS
jgi:hypothetical protein